MYIQHYTNKIIIKKIFNLFVPLLILGVFLALPTKTYAYSIEPSAVEYDLKKGENKFDNITFTNTDNSTHDFKVEILSTENEIGDVNNTQTNITNQSTYTKATDQTLFIKTDKSEFTLNPGESISIPFAILTESNMPIGTYFNVIAIINNDLKNNELINIEGGIGTVVKLNLFDESSDVLGTKDIMNKTELDIKILDYGWINSPMIIQIDFTNNTPYELTPLGSVDIYSIKRLGIIDDPESGPYRFLINESSNTVASGQTITWEYQSNLWDYKSLFAPVKIMAEIVNEGDTIFIEKEISVNHPLKLTLIVLIGLVSLATLVSIINIFLGKNRPDNSK